MTLGSMHASVTDRLKASDTASANTVAAHGDTNPETAFNLLGQAVDKHMRGQEISDDLAARVLLEHVIQKNQTGYQIQDSVKDGYLMLILAKNIAAQFSKDEIAKLYHESHGNFILIDGLLREDAQGNPDNGLLAQKGIALPQSRVDTNIYI